MTTGKNISPFKFLDSYTRADKDIFFGRERETDEVYSKVFQSKILLVYGASGTGKSSLINCGLANKFQDSDWLPIHIRRAGDMRRSMFDQIQKQAVHKVEISEEEKAQDSGLEKVISSVFLDHFKPIYLIFDQFEELFIFGMKEEWMNFISAVKYLMNRDLEVHFIFVMRGEYLEFLSEFEEVIPHFFDNRVRVEKMTRKNAERSILGPAKLSNIEIEDGFEEKLLKKLSPDSSQVELTFLQVFLDKIYRSEANKDNNSVHFSEESLEKIGQIGDVLAEFVDEQLFKMADPKAALAVLKSFVSMQGTKVQRSLEEVRNFADRVGRSLSPNQVEEIVSEFVNKRILKDQDDNGRYELRHDSLAGKIYEKITRQEKELLEVQQFLNHSLHEYEKRGTLLSEEDLKYVQPYLKGLKSDLALSDFIAKSTKNSRRSKQKRRTRAVVIVIILGLLLTSVIGFINSENQKEVAQEMAALATSESEKANQQRLLAEQSREEALRQAQLAEQESQRAEALKSEAETQAQIAIQQKVIADQGKRTAELQRQRAEESEEEARIQEARAAEQSEIARTLRIRSLGNELAVRSAYLTDISLKANLAVLAYTFNQEAGGQDFHPELFAALTGAAQDLNLLDDDQVNHFSSPVVLLSKQNGQILSGSQQGEIIMDEWGSDGSKRLVEADLNVAAYVLDGANILIGNKDGRMISVSLPTGQATEILDLRESLVSVVRLENSDMIFSNAQLGILSKSELEKIPLDFLPRTGIAIGRDAWIGSSRGEIKILNEEGDILETVTVGDRQADISALAASQDQSRIAIGFKSGVIRIFDVGNRRLIETLSGHSAEVTSLEFSPNGELLISGSFDRKARIWQIANPGSAPIDITLDHWVSAVAFDESGERAIVGNYDGSIQRFDLNLERLANKICESNLTELSQADWNAHVATDLDYRKPCSDE